jgi:phosphohistidine phosphatase SixA
MRVFLIRHAKADPGEPDEPDELRPLTESGREQARELAARLSRHATPPAIVLTSPLLRARQTAEPIARATGAEVRIDQRLAPGASATLLREAMEGLDGPVAAVGHQPDCSEIAFALSGRDPGFPAAGMLELELPV